MSLLLLILAQNATLVTAENESISAGDLALRRTGDAMTATYTATGGATRTVNVADLVEISFSGGSAPAERRPGATDIEVTLTTGDLLKGRIGGAAEDAVALRSALLGDVSLPFERIRSVIVPANRASLPRKLPAKADAADLVFIRSGDRGEGFVAALSESGLKYESDALGAVTLPLSEVAGVWLAETQKPPAEPEALFAIATAADGSSIRGTLVSLEKGVLLMKDLYGDERRFPAGSLSGIYMKNGRVVYLSDLEPADVEEEANFIRGPEKLPSDLSYPHRRDRSAKGTPLRLGGRNHRKGVGVRAHSVLSWNLDKTYSRFQATFGLDDVSNGLGAVRAEVWIDDRKALDLEARGRDEPKRVDLDVKGASRLKLLVTWAGTGQSDFADWGSARLIR